MAPFVTANPSSVTVTLHDRVTLSCTASGSPTPSIRWYKDNKAIEGPQSIGNTFVIPEATPDDRGFYQCEAFSSFGSPSRSTEAVLLISGWYIALLILHNTQHDSLVTTAIYVYNVNYGREVYS